MHALVLLPLFLCWGSFLNVLAYRIIKNQSIITPCSYCPHCTQPIAWYDNIPIVSWILLKGRCRICAQPISILYPAIELLTAITFLLLYATHPNYFFGYALFFSALIVTIRSDIETMLISRYATLFLIPAGSLYAMLNLLPLSPLESIAGAFCGYLYLYSVNALYRRIKGTNGIGEGDFDLLAFIGTFTGIYGIWFTVLAGALLGIIASIPYLLIHKKSTSTKIPFGPFLAGASILFILLQKHLINFLHI